MEERRRKAKLVRYINEKDCTPRIATWSEKWRNLILKPDLKYRERFSIFMFLAQHGVDPEDIFDILSSHNRFDYNAKRQLFDLKKTWVNYAKWKDYDVHKW